MKIHYTILSTLYMSEIFCNKKTDFLVEIHNVSQKFNVHIWLKN